MMISLAAALRVLLEPHERAPYYPTDFFGELGRQATEERARQRGWAMTETSRGLLYAPADTSTAQSHG